MTPLDLLQLTKAEERELESIERATRDARTWLEDPAMCRLAHPVRCAAAPATSPAFTTIQLAEPRNQPLLKTMLAKQLATVDIFTRLTDEGDRRVFVFHELHTGAAAAAGGFGNGAAGPTVHALRFATCGGRVYSFTDDLVQQLHKTRLGTDVPLSELRLPHPNIYIELGTSRESAPLSLFHPESGEHPLEGAYISAVTNAAGEQCLEVTLTGSPIGRTELMDDAVEWVQMSAGGTSEHSLKSIADALVEAYTKPRTPELAESGYFDDQERLRDQAQRAIPKLELIAKCILFLGMSEAIQRQVLEGTEAKKALMRAQSGAHKRRAARTAAKSYDRVVVSVAPEPELPEQQVGEVDAGGRTVSTHWREPHMRMQRHGPGLSLTKLVWIRRVLVKPDGLAASR